MSEALTTIKDNNTFKAMLGSESVQAAIVDIAPKHLTPEKIVKMALLAANKNSAIYECSKKSVLQSIMHAAQLGLEFDGCQGQGYLIPYGKTCTFIVGYKGMVALARNSGEVAALHADVICENDTFENKVVDAEQILNHAPPLNNRGKTIGAYAIAKFKDGSKQVAVMGIDDIEAIRMRSKVGKHGPWSTDFGEMAKKTVLRRLMKLMPQVPDLDRILGREDGILYADSRRLINPFMSADTTATADVSASNVTEGVEGA